MFARYASAVASGTFMTLGLLFVMQLLISMQPGAISDVTAGIPVIWGQKIKPTPPPPPAQKSIDRKDLTDVPIPPVVGRRDGTGPLIGVPMQSPGAPTGAYEFKLEEFLDGPLVSMIRVSPLYPAIAAQKGLEGYVILRFDVMPNGQTDNISVIESSSRVFESAAIKAAQRFKFKPRVVDGVALISTGIRNRFTFELDDE